MNALRSLPLALVLTGPLVLNPVAAAQAATPAPAQAQPYVLRAGTQLVILDAKVQDRSGKPIHGLSAGSFSLTEDGKAQNVRSCEEHTPPAVPPSVARPAFPPGTFSDFEPVTPTSTLNVFLLDELNTSVKDQTYAIEQLVKFARHSPSGARIAIFGLRSRLYLLNGFTTDPSNLEAVLRHKVQPGASLLLDDANGTNNDPAKPSDLVSDSTPPQLQPTSNDLLAATLEQFDADRQAFQTQLRIQYTLDAFNQIARYLANFPGRKNIFWFSASFPINLLPTATGPSGIATQNNEQEYRETVNLLTRARVAIYPIDARGLQVPPMYDAARSGRNLARNPASVSTELNTYYASQAIEHQTMDALASDTGGRAFYNNNGLAEAVAKGIDEGENYYTLAYTPSNPTNNGAYRHIRLALTGAAAAQGLQLAYRQGYFAVSNAAPGDAEKMAAQPEAAQTPAAQRYACLAVSHGAPTPSDLIFKVSVLPVAGTPENAVAPGNQLILASNPKGPYRRFAVDFAALPSQIQITRDDTGRYHGAVEFSVFVFDAEGHVLNTAGDKIDLNLTTESYRSFLADAVRFQLNVSAPVQGKSFLRIAVHDLQANRFGVVEIPTEQVAHLTPQQP